MKIVRDSEWQALQRRIEHLEQWREEQCGREAPEPYMDVYEDWPVWPRSIPKISHSDAIRKILDHLGLSLRRHEARPACFTLEKADKRKK